MKFGKGQSVRRHEDKRFITGHGRYTDDIQLENMAYLATVRSPYAHAKILSIDIEDALEMEGVLAIYTQKDMDEAGYGDFPCATALENIDGSKQHFTPRGVMARDVVRFVGDPVAMVVADSRENARNAVDAIYADLEELPAIHNIEAARAEGAAQIWDHAPGNQIFDWQAGDGAKTDEMMAKADHVTSLTLINNRVAPTAMENRAAIGEYDGEQDGFTLTTGTQGANIMQGIVAGAIMKMSPKKLRVVTPDVGGGFGMKFFVYPEYIGVLHAAKNLGRPVKWTGERSDSFMTDTHGRDLVTKAELGLDKSGKILGLKIHTAANLGGYISTFGAGIQTVAGGFMVGGVYDIPAIHNRVTGYATNTAPVDAYRGAGRPEAAYLTERLMDQAARELGLGQDEIRSRNFIQSEQMPYTTGVGTTYDTGEFETVLQMGKDRADWNGFAARKSASEAKGKLRGIGLTYYVEIAAGGPQEEYTEVKFTSAGKVELLIGTQSTGQGHETAYAQILADELDIPYEAITVIQGDTARIAQGNGTGGSRSIHVGGGAVIEGAKSTIEEARPIAAHLLEADMDELDYQDGNFQVRGTNRGISMMDLGQTAANPQNLPQELQEKYPNGFSVKAKYQGTHPSFPNGCHIAEVEIDPDTGVVDIQSYTAVDDFGRLLNPLLAAGQVHGGVVQGIGQALHEEAVYEEGTAQLVTGSFMDYTMPRADDIPHIEFDNHVVVNPNNPLGVKGCGEAGTIGASPTIMHAILNALQDRGITHVDMPATPLKIWQLLQEAKAA